MKIRTKINFGLSVSMIFLLIVGITGITYLSKTGKLSADIYNNNLLPIFLIEEIEALINDINMITHNHIVSQDPDKFQSIEGEIKKKFNLLHEEINHFSSKENTLFMTGLIKSLNDETAEYKKININVLKLSREFYKEDAMHQVHAELEPTLQRIRIVHGDIMSHLKTKASHDLTISQSNVSLSTKYIVIIIIAGFLLSVSNGLYISGSIKKSIAKTVRYFRMLAHGNTSNKFVINTNDEIGELAQAFNEIVDVISNLIAEANMLTEAAVEGRLDIRGNASKFQGDYANIISGLNNTLDAIVDPLSISAGYIDRISKGDIPETVTETHKGDFQKLNNSLIRLITNLNEIINQADRIAQGDFSTNIKLLSEEDRLGSALQIMNESLLNVMKQAHAIANGDYHVNVDPRSDKDELGIALSHMTDVLREVTKENEQENWLKTGQTKLNDIMRGELDIQTLSQNIIRYLATYLNVQIGALYIADNNDVLKLEGTYAFTPKKNHSVEIEFGTGLAGEAAASKEIIHTTNVPDNYMKITSGLVDAVPVNIVSVPFLYEGKIKGVLELGSFHETTDLHLDFLKEVVDNIAININTAQSRSKMKQLLAETQNQAEELQSQQEELRQTNEELEEQAQILERQKKDINEKNIELMQTQQTAEEKAKELEISSKYKSQFLANMSHELRTPLNSLLLLSMFLMENKNGNLTEKQIEYARTIHSAGSDLLHLINDILDLSKIEAGRIEITPDNVNIGDFLGNIERNFRHVANEKGISMIIEKTNGLPESIFTDSLRLEQIIKNLISNAIKFTAQGSVTVSVCRPGANVDLASSDLNSSNSIAIDVADTGIGIPQDKLRLIFKAFQQVDGTTSRHYGGTGLGLSISKELAELLGGEIKVQSVEGKGSKFTVYLPERIEKTDKSNKIISLSGSGNNDSGVRSHPSNENIPCSIETLFPDRPFETEDIRDDRRNIFNGDKTILIIEDDPRFAKILYDFTLKKEFKGLIAGDGEAGLHLADFYNPSAIILDINLPGLDGWTVMDKLRKNPKTRNIPVHFMSVHDRKSKAMKMGAIGYLRKPVSLEKLNGAFGDIETIISRTMKKILIAESNGDFANDITGLIDNKNVRTTTAKTGKETYDFLKSGDFDCMILDMELNDISGIKLLEKIRNDKTIHHMPIILYTDKNLTEDEEAELEKYAERIIIKGAKFPQRLLDETELFLFQVESDMPKEKQNMINMVRDKEAVLKDKKILLVDDDMRNTFALTSLLEESGMKVLIGKNGREALNCLDENPDIDLVLMDIMMPEMNGYESIQEIRKQERFKKLPIITLTAKAMRGDRKKSIDAGANDYLSKPVNVDKLLSLLKVWLYH